MVTNLSLSFSHEPSDEGPLARLYASLPPGGYIAIVRPLDPREPVPELRVQRPGREPRPSEPFPRETYDHRPIPFTTGLELAATLFEAHERAGITRRPE